MWKSRMGQRRKGKTMKKFENVYFLMELHTLENLQW